MSELAFRSAIAQPERLLEAWHRVRRAAGGPGIDGMSIDTFKQNTDRRLLELRHRLLSGEYKPNAVRRVGIPKSGGGTRLLGIPTVVDRIAQTAAALILQEHLASTFSPRSFAYRPFLGPRRAATFLVSRMDGAAYAVTADIERFFDNVEHEIVTKQLGEAGVDDDGVRTVLRWLRAPTIDNGTRLTSVKGIPQGGPVSPVIANLYLTGFDRMLEADGHLHVRYADDCAPRRRKEETVM